MKLVSNFAERFTYILNQRDIKPSKFSDLSNVNKSTISQYMSGLYEPKRERIDLFAKILNVSPAWLIGYDVPMNDQQKSTKQEWYIDTSMLTQSERFELENILSFNTIQFFKGGNNLTEDEIEELKYILTKLYLKECGYDVK